MEKKEGAPVNTPANFLPRIIWGSVILLVVVAFFALRILSAYVFDVLIAGLMIVCALEVENVLHKMNRPTHTVAVALYPILCFATVMLIANSGNHFAICVIAMLLVLLALGVILFAYPLIFTKFGRRAKEKDEFGGSLLHYSFMRTLNTMFVCLWPTFLFSFAFIINHYDLLSGSGLIEAYSNPAMGVNFGLLGLVLLFATTMFADTFAMLTGRFIGGPKISITKLGPGKSWTGLVGGIAGACIASLIVYFVFNSFYGYNVLFSSQGINFGTFLLGGLFCGIFNMAGDIFSSFFKRRAVIKDFSQLIPGHGGVMDRYNGLVCNAVFVFIFFIILFG